MARKSENRKTIEHHAAAIVKLIRDMPSRDRRRLYDEMSRLTTTNCGWFIYGIKPFVQDVIRTWYTPRK